MKKIIFWILIWFILSLSSGVSYYYNNWNYYYNNYNQSHNWNYYRNYYYNQYYIKVDKCCIIETINYKEKLQFINETIYQQYPHIAQKVSRTVSDIVSLVENNSKYKYRKAKIYKVITEKIIDYVYNHNIKRWTPTYLMLSYFTYRIYDMYEYEKSKDKYNLENLIDKLDANPYDY